MTDSDSPKKVFVSGCYDMLHSGHVAHLQEAAQYGDLYVGIGSDATMVQLKGRNPINHQNERLYMIKALRCVKDAWISSGSGVLDFEKEIEALKPDILFVNEEGANPAKEQLCNRLGIRYIVGRRVPHGDLPARSTTALREEIQIPYRIDLAGGWLDQPYVSKHYPGSVITLCIEPDYEFNDRSGMATSSRKKAVELWKTQVPRGDRPTLARALFCFENPPGSPYISGSQDSFGIVYPGLNRHDYKGNYLPEETVSVLDGTILTWLEEHLYLMPLYPRVSDYDVLADTHIDEAGAKRLSEAAAAAWDAIMARDAVAFGRAVTASFNAQIAMFPNMANAEILSALESTKGDAIGWKISGAGGGGYFIFVAPDPASRRGMLIRVRAD